MVKVLAFIKKCLLLWEKNSGRRVKTNAMYISKEKGCRTSPETKLVVKPTYKPMGQKFAAESFIILIISDGIGCQPHPIIVH